MASPATATPTLPQQELDQPETPSPVMSRYSTSVTSDGVSSSGSAFITPSYISSSLPLPCYISRESASRVASELYQTQKELELDMPIGVGEERVLISDTATSYANSFLDKLLHDILAHAQSTQLEQLRIASLDTLKKTLGKEAVSYANNNLEDLLAGAEDEQEQPGTTSANWDLEYAWKRTRLRVMMRSENSDFDIDDDERYSREAGLAGPGRRFGDTTAAVISLHSEIFLAGILDFICEHLIAVALIPASIRMRRASPKATDTKFLLVEDFDMERGVLNSPLDRHWRAWRKSTRSRTGYLKSPSLAYSPSWSNTRRGSSQWGDSFTYPSQPEPLGPSPRTSDTPAPGQEVRDLSDLHYPEHVMASNIPLPLSDSDATETSTPTSANDATPKTAESGMSASLRDSRGITTVTDSLPLDPAVMHYDASSLDETETISDAIYLNENQSLSSLYDPTIEEAMAVIPPPPSPPRGLVRQHSFDALRSNPGPAHPASPRRSSKRSSAATVGVSSPKSPRPTTFYKRDSPITDSEYKTASSGQDSDETETETIEDAPVVKTANISHLSRSDSAPLPSYAGRSVSKPTALRINTRNSGFVPSRSTPNSLGTLSATEVSFTRPNGSPKFGVVTSVSGGEGSPVSPSSKSPGGLRKVSAPAGRLVDDLARARNSSSITSTAPPKMRQLSLNQDRENLRRIAAERTSSLSSTTDSQSSFRRQSSLTSASMVTPEDFDSLLSGGDTIKMTLSPDTVRDAPASSQPERSPSVASLGTAGKSAHGRSGSDSSEITRTPSRPLFKNGSPLLARGATALTKSTRDFADFIRSTGPDFESRSQRPSVGEVDRRLSGFPESISPPAPNASQASGIKVKRNHVPREARGSEPSNNAGLIDFIRSGPEDGKDNKPSKEIAPFRYSLDNDDFLNSVVNIDSARTPRASVSTQNTTQTFSSHAPLVQNGTRQASVSSQMAAPTHKPTKTQKSSYVTNADGQRRYRNKDPYAIDMSSDEEDSEELPSAGLKANGNGIIEEVRPTPPPKNGPMQGTKVVIPRNAYRPAEPRESRPAQSSSTRELADFFRDNEPPSSIMSRPNPISEEAKRGFWRKKRQADVS